MFDGAGVVENSLQNVSRSDTLYFPMSAALPESAAKLRRDLVAIVLPIMFNTACGSQLDTTVNGFYKSL